MFWSRPDYHGTVTRVVRTDRQCHTLHPRIQEGQDRTGPARPVLPADAVTASGSGLDPEISPAYAKLQEATVAKARGTSVDQVAALARSKPQDGIAASSVGRG